MDFQGEGLPLMRLEQVLPVKPLPRENGDMVVIIPKEDNPPAGILVSKILDAVETEVAVKHEPTQHPALSGSAFINGQLTLFLDPVELVSRYRGEDRGSLSER
jgi:two-component system chemotaxis sensor kinase CheA